jgi:polyhydroxyalkanoate synthesis regulator phasin
MLERTQMSEDAGRKGMSDIVKRLRVWPLRRGYSEVSIRRTMREAADEIEKLRAALRDIARQPEGDEESAQAIARAVLGEKQ